MITNLKNYLISEAKDKGRLPADAQVPLNEGAGIFKGLAAAVPQQPNMSDCGLYVLHFMEVFLQHCEELLPFVVSCRRTVTSISTDTSSLDEKA